MPLIHRAVPHAFACAALMIPAFTLAAAPARAQPPTAPQPIGVGQADQASPALAQQLAALQGRVEALDGLAIAVRSLSARLARLARLQGAQAALDEGRPLGPIPDAPPPLARFADLPPPTLAALRETYPEAAEAARRASAEAGSGGGFFARIWARMAALVTLRDGDRVLIGTPATATLATSRALLEAGDLRAALAELDRLDPAARAAMAAWRSRADALIAARDALQAALEAAAG